jgi:hypothetical protein
MLICKSGHPLPACFLFFELSWGYLCERVIMRCWGSPYWSCRHYTMRQTFILVRNLDSFIALSLECVARWGSPLRSRPYELDLLRCAWLVRRFTVCICIRRKAQGIPAGLLLFHVRDRRPGRPPPSLRGWKSYRDERCWKSGLIRTFICWLCVGMIFNNIRYIY